ncbi:MAG TPA: 23S rRNA (guanosine(2251)-2'-O)-methyltransferase RlmB [Caulobacteraceae bacterium]|nr:23S rRNA (guanosine(2251)-2'-O)-methyltransferase RlmB [Caulobacteraceae bacterium]
MSSSHERNDRKHRRPQAEARGQRGSSSPAKPWSGHGRDKDGAYWLWGWHPVAAALANPQRPAPQRLLASAERAHQLTERFGRLADLEVVEANALRDLLPSGAIHQGVALKTPPIEPVAIDKLGALPGRVLLMLDQVTDPQNVGAIFRSAAALGASGLILQDRHAPALSGALAKAAAGAIDALPHARVVNLSRALERLAELGWRAVGLDGSAIETLAEALDDRPTVLVMGSEGEGLRRLVAEHCDALARIPMPGGFESLNVSAAAAIALYEAVSRRAPSA